MKPVPNKKIVFVIVEGPSDDVALGYFLERIYEKSLAHFHIMHCDITTERNVNSANILNKVGDVVKTYKNSNHLKTSDCREIIHIVDMDGAYIPDETILFDEETGKVVYSESNITTDNVQGIKERNRNKRSCIDKLSSTPNLCGIPYQSYYMSCNLDHVLYNKLNTSDEEKENDAYAFVQNYKDDVNSFVEYMTESDFAVNGDYLSSWKYIKEQKHSLERHSNLCICIKRALEQSVNNEHIVASQS